MRTPTRMTPRRRARCMSWLAGMRSRRPLCQYYVFVTQRRLSRCARTFADMLEKMIMQNTDGIIATFTSGSVRG